MPIQKEFAFLCCLAALSASPHVLAQQSPMVSSPCSRLQCQNGGICVLGGSVVASQDVSIGDAHCVCQPGWTGATCEEPFDSCSAESPCQNNGVCVLGLRDDWGNEQPFCDCNPAVDDNGIKYVGKFCEHQAVSYCDGQGSFCVSGDCNPSYQTSDSALMCICKNGYGGPHCEFQKGDEPNCDLDCQNGGHCIMGETSDLDSVYHYWDNSENQNDMMHCKCKDGFDGPLCEHEKSACGDSHCFNGAACVEKIGSDGTSHFHCDCTTASTDEISFAGRFCQYASTTFCTSAQLAEGALFCVNNGTCKEDAFEGCDCPPGFTGFSCEFQTETFPAETSPTTDPNSISTQQADGAKSVNSSTVDDPDYYSCDMTCQHGGVCRKGEKDVSNLGPMAQDIAYLNQTSNEDFEYCVCQPGFSGIQCEIRVEVCGEGEHLCLHGSKCVKNGEYHACDCSEGDEPIAGPHCEHKASGICTAGELMPGKPLSFCVNGGTCKDQVKNDEVHPGCDCTDDWTGPHCELKVSSEERPSTYDNSAGPIESSSHGSLVAEIMLLLFCLVLLAALILYFFSKYVRNKKARAADAESIHFLNKQAPYRDEPNISPHRDSVMDPFPKRFRSSSSDPFVGTESTRKPSRAQETLEPVEIC